MTTAPDLTTRALGVADAVMVEMARWGRFVTPATIASVDDALATLEERLARHVTPLTLWRALSAVQQSYGAAVTEATPFFHRPGLAPQIIPTDIQALIFDAQTMAKAD